MKLNHKIKKIIKRNKNLIGIRELNLKRKNEKKPQKNKTMQKFLSFHTLFILDLNIETNIFQ